MAKNVKLAQIKELQEDEIDLFELAQTLWAKKKTISLFVLLGFIPGFLYYAIKGIPYRYEFYIYPRTIQIGKEEMPLPKRNFYIEELKKLTKRLDIPTFKIKNERSSDEYIAIEIEDTEIKFLKENAQKILNALKNLESFMRMERLSRELLEKELFTLRKDRNFIKEIQKQALQSRSNFVLGFDILERDYQLRVREVFIEEILKSPALFFVEMPEPLAKRDTKKAILVIFSLAFTGFFVGIFYVFIQKGIENRKKAHG